MGYSYRQDARRTMNKIEAHIKAENAKIGETSWSIKGKKYFFETTRRDQSDGGIRGTIWQFVGETYAKKVGSFAIDGDGNLIRGPKIFKDAIKLYQEKI